MSPGAIRSVERLSSVHHLELFKSGVADLDRWLRSSAQVAAGAGTGVTSGDAYAGMPMQRTTVKLPDDLDARLRQEAQRRGTTISDVTRTAIEAHLGVGPQRRLGAAGAGHSGRNDISERIEEIIAAEAGGSH